MVGILRYLVLMGGIGLIIFTVYNDHPLNIKTGVLFFVSATALVLFHKPLVDQYNVAGYDLLISVAISVLYLSSIIFLYGSRISGYMINSDTE